MWPLQSEIGCAFVADGTNGAKVRGIVGAAKRLIDDATKLKPRSARWVVGVRLARYCAAHLASGAVAVEDEGACLLGDCAAECRFRCGVEQEASTGFEVVAVVASENLTPLLGAKLTDSTRPLGNPSSHAAELVRVHNLPDVLEEMRAEIVSGSHR